MSSKLSNNTEGKWKFFTDKDFVFSVFGVLLMVMTEYGPKLKVFNFNATEGLITTNWTQEITFPVVLFLIGAVLNVWGVFHEKKKVEALEGEVESTKKELDEAKRQVTKLEVLLKKSLPIDTEDFIGLHAKLKGGGEVKGELDNERLCATMMSEMKAEIENREKTSSTVNAEFTAYMSLNAHISQNIYNKAVKACYEHVNSSLPEEQEIEGVSYEVDKSIKGEIISNTYHYPSGNKAFEHSKTTMNGHGYVIYDSNEDVPKGAPNYAPLVAALFFIVQEYSKFDNSEEPDDVTDVGVTW